MFKLILLLLLITVNGVKHTTKPVTSVKASRLVDEAWKESSVGFVLSEACWKNATKYFSQDHHLTLCNSLKSDELNVVVLEMTKCNLSNKMNSHSLSNTSTIPKACLKVANEATLHTCLKSLNPEWRRVFETCMNWYLVFCSRLNYNIWYDQIKNYSDTMKKEIIDSISSEDSMEVVRDRIMKFLEKSLDFDVLSGTIVEAIMKEVETRLQKEQKMLVEKTYKKVMDEVEVKKRSLADDFNRSKNALFSDYHLSYANEYKNELMAWGRRQYSEAMDKWKLYKLFFKKSTPNVEELPTFVQRWYSYVTQAGEFVLFCIYMLFKYWAIRLTCGSFFPDSAMSILFGLETLNEVILHIASYRGVIVDKDRRDYAGYAWIGFTVINFLVPVLLPLYACWKDFLKAAELETKPNDSTQAKKQAKKQKQTSGATQFESKQMSCGHAKSNSTEQKRLVSETTSSDCYPLMKPTSDTKVSGQTLETRPPIPATIVEDESTGSQEFSDAATYCSGGMSNAEIRYKKLQNRRRK